MSWLIITIFAYFLSAIVSLFDKYLLKGPIPGSRVYSFYVGILGILIVVLVPFVDFLIPTTLQLLLSLLAGAFFIFSLSIFLKAVKLFEVSRVVPTIGALTPLFVLGFTFLSAKQILGPYQFGALLFLLAGTFLISWGKGKTADFKCLWLSILSAFLFSLAFFLSKIVYLSQPFWSGFIWMRVGGFLMALFFLFSKEVREELFIKRVSFKPKTANTFLLGQIFGAGSLILQNWAIALVPLGFLAFVNALEGSKYIFVFIFATFLSLRFPKILKEEISKAVLLQKVVAILLIGGGLALLVL